jgi:hypothetical protein
LLDEDFNRIRAVGRRSPFSVRPERYPLPPLSTEATPVGERHGMGMPPLQDTSMLVIIGL